MGLSGRERGPVAGQATGPRLLTGTLTARHGTRACDANVAQRPRRRRRPSASRPTAAAAEREAGSGTAVAVTLMSSTCAVGACVAPPWRRLTAASAVGSATVVEVQV